MSVQLGIPGMRETSIPARENVKFYQVGSFAVGNRLAEEDYRSVQSDPNRWNTLTSGHRACQGCGEALGARYALDSAAAAADGDLVAVNATGCLEVFSTPYPESAWTVPWLHSLFGNAPAVAAGAAAGLRAKGRTTRVVAQGGDGGTVDIGMGCLSGMFERNDDVLYICYDNEAYMNTGVQRSGATPPSARTATTQPVGPNPGNRFGQGKDMARIAMAHEIPYVATATVADLRDLEYKVTKAMGYHGARYIHVLVPCPLGWGAASNITVKLARLATQTGLFPVFEAEGGEITSVTKIRRPAPVEEYLRPQRRFAHLFKGEGDRETLARLQAIADRNIRRYGLIDEDQLDEDVLERVLAAPEDPEGRYDQILHAAAQTKQGRAEAAALAQSGEQAPPMGLRRPQAEPRASLRADAPEQE
ncbi:thiamine pyrophosphate-dependent enzyme [Actinomyces culturomici]|uniref:thiamine pyrophosphate-dependent enzyme n=1 Tax=Actinomyces culturomici TaxID=1926276 RepID=UPI000E205C9C|nr:thiamine pyrophosphate-dependent enzyme [Actinomyces culturomici]